MTTQDLNDIISKIKKFDYKLELLLQKGGNNESIISKKRQCLTQYFELKKELKDERIL